MTSPKTMIALTGVESTGKSTLAMMLAARLRSRGVLAECVREPGADLPFPVEELDTGDPTPWIYMISRRLATETQMMMRPNVEVIILDRTPLDYAAYYMARYRGIRTGQAKISLFYALAVDWCTVHYQSVYFLDSHGVTYRKDGFRAENNTWRDDVEHLLRTTFSGVLQDRLHVVSGSYRERAEFVYHHIISDLYGETRPLRAYAQVRSWLQQRGHRVSTVTPQGSNSVVRFHPPTDHDDIDMMVVVDGDADYAIKVREDFLAHKDHLENIVQANLDVLVVPAGMEAYEV